MPAKKNPVININTALKMELTTVKGIGSTLAKEIIHHRPYSKLHDLVNVPGINEIKLNTLSPYLTVKTSKMEPPTSDKNRAQVKTGKNQPITKLGETEAFIFLEDRNERQDALLILLGGFILGLIIILLRRKDD